MRRALIATTLALLALAAPASAASRSCPEPSGVWDRATPAEAGFDADGLQAALDYGTSQTSYAVRVYRRGCLVGVDRAGALTQQTRYQSWSMAKSITALVAMRAMTLGLLSPEDPVGALLPEADQAHGAITVRDLLTMTSGLRWTFARDYDLAMPDRLRDALTVDVARPPGTYYEYSQSGPALLAEAVSRAVGEDFQAFAQRELFGPIGIGDGAWHWGRDQAGHTQGFFDLHMTVDDYARLGELMRRGGVWNGRRLLSRRTVRSAVTPTATNGCYGWMIWVNAAKPCVGPRVVDRPVDDTRSFPSLPEDMYYYAGLFGQVVAVFPSQDLMVVRTGQELDPGLAGGEDYQEKLFRMVLQSITDQTVTPPPDASDVPSVSREDVDHGILKSLTELDQVAEPFALPPLPAAGPARARAARLSLARKRVSRRGVVRVRVACPARWPGREPQPCLGSAGLTGAAKPRAYRVAPGAARVVKLRVGRNTRKGLPATLTLSATNRDAAGGTASAVPVRVRRPR